jgi:hypothetical protein
MLGPTIVPRVLDLSTIPFSASCKTFQRFRFRQLRWTIRTVGFYKPDRGKLPFGHSLLEWKQCARIENRVIAETPMPNQNSSSNGPKNAARIPAYKGFALPTERLLRAQQKNARSAPGYAHLNDSEHHLE